MTIKQILKQTINQILGKRSLTWLKVQNKKDGASFIHSSNSLSLIVSVAVEQDGKVWGHLSVASRNENLPTWEDLKTAKDLFFGEDTYAIQILPGKKEYVNLLSTCLHLFVPIGHRPNIPEFSRGGRL